MKLEEHPTVKAYRERSEQPRIRSGPLQAERLRRICIDAGADDAGFVEIDRPEPAGWNEELVKVCPQTWVDFISKEKSFLPALLTRKIKVKGSAGLMTAFAKCFPS